MLKTFKKLFAVVMAAAVAAALCVTSFAADYTATLGAKDVDGTIVDGYIADDGSFTVEVPIVSGTNNDKSINFYLKGDALDPEFWNRNDAFVEVDLTLLTESSTITAILPAFADGWKWVNPTVWGTTLKVNQTVTIREPLSTYYSGGFNANKPMLIRAQLSSAATEVETIRVAVSGLRFVNIDGAAEVTTTTAAVEEPVEDTPAEETPADQPEDVPADTTPEEEAPAATTTTTAADTTKAEENNDTAATSASDSTSAATTTRAGANIQTEDSSLTTMIIVIVIVAGVVVAGAIVGYMIYRKKKYY